MRYAALLLFSLVGSSVCFADTPLLKTQKQPLIEFQFGIASYAFRDKTLDELILCAKKIGVKQLALKATHLPLDSTDDQIAEVLQKVHESNLEVYAGGVIYMQDKQSVEQAFAYAQRAGMQMIVGVPNPELLDQVEQLVKATGIKIAIHIHGDRNILYPDAESVYSLIKDRDPRVGICVDVGHTLRVNQDPAEIIRRYHDRVLDVQLWDCSSASHEGKSILAGYGVMDLSSVLQALVDIRYMGTVSVEYWDDSAHPEYGTAYTVGYLEGILSTLGVRKQVDALNVLTDQENSAGWQLLFDGHTTNGWRGINQSDFPREGWAIENGEICCLANDGAESSHGGDLITVKKYSDFELSWEWKMLNSGGNSGVKYFVLEGIDENEKHGVGLEYQILDDANHPWMLQGKMKPGDYRTVASVYEFYPAKNKKLKPLGQYNHSRIVSKGRHVEHWLNGIKVLEYERGSSDYRAKLAASESKDITDFGEASEGHILLQDHGSQVCFRNIKIREL